MLRSILGTLLGLGLLPPFLLYQIVRYLLLGPSHPAWHLPTELFCASLRFLSLLSSGRLASPRALPDTGARVAHPDSAFVEPWIARWTVGRGARVSRVRAQAAGDEWVRGIAREGKGRVRAVDVPAFWVVGGDDGRAVDRAADEGEKVIMYLAGGGIAPLLSPTPYALARASGLRVLAVSYPTARSTATAFPAQLLDALAGWLHLTRAAGVKPEHILLAGESAGAFAALALLRYLGELRDADVDGGMPGGAVLVSPACNMARLDHPVVRTDYRLPYYRRRVAPALAHHFLPAAPPAPDSLAALAGDAYFSPARAPPGAFAHLARVRVRVLWGDGELFADDVRALVAGMARDGVDVRADEVPGGLHCGGTMGRAAGVRGRSWEGFVGAVGGLGWSAGPPLR